LDRKIVGIILIALIAIVSTASLSSLVLSQLNQTGSQTGTISNPPSPKPEPTPELTPSPTLTPMPSPSEEPTETTSLPKPSVPEFTLTYVDLSYDVPPTYGIDQYTGETIITEGGYHVDNRSIQFTIKNQPFTPYTDANGTQIGLYYNFRVKGAYATEWSRYYPFAENGITTRRYGGIFGGNSTESPADFAQSNAQYTTISIAIGTLLYDVPTEATLEFQVQALIGYMEPTDYMLAGHVYVFKGETSGWSETQTITIP
jgi:hypothetical protein